MSDTPDLNSEAFDAEIDAIKKELEESTASYSKDLEGARADLNQLLGKADAAMEEASKELEGEDTDE